MNVFEHVSFPELAERVCALYNEEQDALLLAMLGQEYIIRRDGVLLRGQRAPEGHAAVIRNYLLAPAVQPVLGPWKGIGDFTGETLPDFREKVEKPIIHYAAEVISRANALLPMLDAEHSPAIINSDLAFTVRALPKVYLHVELCQETQDFPSEAWVLFSNNAGAFLTVPSLQVLAELFKDRLLSLLRIY